MGGRLDASEAAVDARADASADAPPETGCANPVQCALRAALAHRYTFSGAGTAVNDSVGTANAAVVNTTLAGNGTLVLAGGTNDQYVNFPNGIIKSLTNVTVEMWITWMGGAAWQRAFDFGDSTGAEGTQGQAVTTFYLSPQGGGPTTMLAAFKRSDQTGPTETRAVGAAALPMNTMVHIAVVLDSTNHLLSLYLNGAPDGSIAFPDSPAVLNDINNWLGRSQYSADPHFGGIYHEFRIYNAALTAAQVQASFMAGTDPAYLN